MIDRDGAVVAHPGVVDGHDGHDDALPVDVRAECLAHLVRIVGDNQHALVLVFKDGARYFNIACCDFVYHLGPVGTHVGPCNEYAVLAIPFGRKSAVSL